MEIYRYISKKEYEEIFATNNIRLWDAKKWGKNEGAIASIFEEENHKRATQLINSIAKYYQLDLNVKSQFEGEEFPNSLDKMYCDIYTEIIIFYKLCVTSFCQCWSTKKRQNKINLNNYENYYARIDAETSERSEEQLNNNGYIKNWVLRYSQASYEDYGYSNAIEKIINHFNNNDRRFTYFMKTLQSKHKDQKEIRLIATLNDFKIEANKLTFPWWKYLDKRPSIDELIKELAETANQILENYNKYCYCEKHDRYIYCPISNISIKKLTTII